MSNKESQSELGVANTDRELWREREGDYYADSISVTKQGAIAIDVGGTVIAMSLKDWGRLALGKLPSPPVERTQDEQPVISVLFRKVELMPDGSIGAVFIGEFAGDRTKDLRLTVAQAQTLADQITQKVGNHTIFEQGAPPNALQ